MNRNVYFKQFKIKLWKTNYFSGILKKQTNKQTKTFYQYFRKLSKEKLCYYGINHIVKGLLPLDPSPTSLHIFGNTSAP